MSSIGSINRLFHQINLAPGFNLPGPEKGVEHVHGIENPEADVLEQGSWWKNKAVAVGRIDPGAENCACRRCPSCVSGLYAVQANSLSPLSSPDKPYSERGDGGVRNSVGNAAEKMGSGQQLKEEGKKIEEKIVEGELDIRQQMELAQLKAIDATVRSHERAHLAAGGGVVRGGASYQYRVGPDGRRYAVGGEVGIDVSEGTDPEETIRRMERVRAAALAPAAPSSQDRRVAAQAALVIMRARIEISSPEGVGEGQMEQGRSGFEDDDVRITSESA